MSRPPEPPGVPARRAALRLLDAVLRRGEPLEAALPVATREIHGPDRGLAHAIAAETLRRLSDLDAMIDSATERNLPDDAKARMVLRIALVQALVLGTPHHAAIATVLPLVDGGPRKLVHGVFGALIRSGMLLPEIPALPDSVAARWESAWGASMVDAAAVALAAPPALDIMIADPDATEVWKTRLGGKSLMRGHLRLREHAPVVEMEGYADGAWWVQDIAASLPARMLGTSGGHVLDLCAAPGGKAMQLAGAGWQVTSVDASQARLKRMRENLHRTRIKVDVVRADVREWRPEHDADAVLLDAPCSATGIFRRHPDVLHRVRPAMIHELAALQTQLLVRASAWVKPGGHLIYASCSLEPAEGEAQIDAFLRTNAHFTIEPPDAAALPCGVEPHERGWVRTHPALLANHGGMDGFFIAKLKRRA